MPGRYVGGVLVPSLGAILGPITIIVEEDDAELSAEMKAVLDEMLEEDEKTYISAEESISRLNKK